MRQRSSLTPSGAQKATRAAKSRGAMPSTFTDFHDYSVEVWFPIEKDKDGYPSSKDWEQLIAYPIIENDKLFKLASIPFYLRNVSLGDVVKANVTTLFDDEMEVFVFDSVVQRGGHNTYRLLLKRPRSDALTDTITDLLSRGMAVEHKDNDFLAVDVPPGLDQHKVDAFLIEQADHGRWGMQDGNLNNNPRRSE
jgi:Domain of unknown function (DUF4265)